MKIEVYDWDAGSGDDFLGVTNVDVTDLVASPDTMSKWIALSEAKHGEIHLVTQWKEAEPIPTTTTAGGEEGGSADVGKIKSVLISLFIDRCVSAK